MPVEAILSSAVGPLVGGALALLGGWWTSMRVTKQNQTDTSMKISRDSAREMVSLLVDLVHSTRGHQEPGSLYFSSDAIDLVDSARLDIRKNARFISDSRARAAIYETLVFLSPPGHFYQYAQESFQSVLNLEIVRIGDIVEAHVHGLPNPPEPKYLLGLRKAYEEAGQHSLEEAELRDEWEAEERAKRRQETKIRYDNGQQEALSLGHSAEAGSNPPPA